MTDKQLFPHQLSETKNYESRWISVGESLAGPVRTCNEDRIYADDALGLWCVADGMGGHSEGGVASSLITQSLEDLRAVQIDNIEDLLSKVIEILKTTNQIIYSLATEMFESKQIMGSTFVLLLLSKDKGYALWAGDSRLYRMRDVYFEQITIDHTQYEALRSQHLLDEMSEYSTTTHPASHILTRAVGVSEQIEIDIQPLDVKKNDVFLLCTDGLYNVMDQMELGKLLYYADDYSSALKTLIHTGMVRETSDNLSAVIVGDRDA